MDFDIRFSEEKDGVFLKKWLLKPGELFWFPMSKEKEVEEVVKNWMGFSRFKASLTAEGEKQVYAIGTLFLMPYRKTAHQALFYLLVGPEHRKKGIGFSMVKNLVNLARKYFRLERLQIELYEGSPLISILQKQEFRLVFTQKNYVKEKDSFRARLFWEKVL